MVREGKLTKLRSSVLKKLQSMNKLGRCHGSSIAATTNHSDEEDSAVVSVEKVPVGFQAVYVGKSRRRYVISSEVINHPLFRELVEKSDGSDSIIVGCEVVLFEHMLWMLQNGDPQPESLDELVQFYAC